jgi:hypothetical protein
MQSNMLAGMYEVFEAQGKLPEPEWPELGDILDWIDKAFGNGFIIDDPEHSLIQRLLGRI